MPAPDLYQVQPNGRLRFDLHAGQWEAWNQEARYVTISAGTQGGKTSFGPLWLFREIQDRGPGDYLIAAPTYPLLGLKLLPELTRFYDSTLKLGRYVASPNRRFEFSPEGQERTFGRAYRTPTKILIGHAQDPDSLESATALAAWLDEAGQRRFKRGSFEAIERRLSLAQGRILTTTTPYSAFGWFKQILHDRAKGIGQPPDPDYAFVNFESRMNPAFPQAEWERAQARLEPWKFDLMYRGLLTRPAGMIYGVFSRERHVIEPHPLPPTWQKYIGVDFGGANTAAVVLTENPMTRELIITHEYLEGDRSTEQHATAIKTWGPFSMGAGGNPSETQYRMDWNAENVPLAPPAFPEVEVGISRVYSLLATDRLRIFSSCAGTIGEFETYSRKLDENDEPTETIADKQAFHRLDALRYIGTLLTGQFGNFPDPVNLTDDEGSAA